MVTENETADKKMSDHDFVSALIGHISEPCEVKGNNLRGMYIREAQRALDTNTVQDAVERERLEAVVRMARVFLSIEFPNAPSHTDADPKLTDLASAVKKFLEGGDVMNEQNRKIVMKVVTFLAAPTKILLTWTTCPTNLEK